MSSITYIVSWDEVVANTKDICSQMLEGDVDYKVIDVTTSSENRNNWVKTGTVRYYNHFNWAIKDFLDSTKDVFIFNAGDTNYYGYAEYTRKIESLFASDPDIWVLAPNCGNDPFIEDGSRIERSTKHPGLYLSLNTNGIWVAFSRELVEKLETFFSWAHNVKLLDFSTMVSGWGLDSVYAAMTILENKKVYRDSSVLVGHPHSSSYDHAKAEAEYKRTICAYIAYQNYLNNGTLLATTLFDFMYEKVHLKSRLNLSFHDVYLNYYPEGDELPWQI